MTLRVLIALAALAALTLTGIDAAKDEKPEKESPIVATVNGEPVTKAEWAVIWKADQWHAPTLKNEAGFGDKMRGKPYEDFFFKEEVVKIRAMAQKYKDALPQMKATIDDLHAKVKAGADMEALAKEHSQDAGTAARGGMLDGPKELHQLVFPFNRIALSMKAGELSEPFMTIFGYHFLRVEKVFPPVPTEAKGKAVEVRHILIRFPSENPLAESETLASQAKVEILDKGLCKKLVSYCPAEG